MTNPTTPDPNGDPPRPDPTADTSVNGPEDAASPASTAPSRRRYLIAASVTAILLAAATGIWFFMQRDSPLEAAREVCGAGRTDWAMLGDEGRSLTLRSVGAERTGLKLEQLQCYLTELKVPDAVIAEIEGTRALDGRQSGEWDDMRASWIYHPDDGLQMIITFAD
ncbi:hypothetical protein JOD64_000372 [Micromonospora luteifusca]|uniref:Uncharacterized protein n=1 Tax=Micromonospora luteifusca TaxID=709860 RepID=A0ABS2LLU4_9ACTN|nr:hypothetical protein [Micromonospora luteifusca]MBM7489150.1 hypothetical protein [Micromonospora luteifusca]